MPIDHWMMFGTFGQQRYFEYPRRGTYKGVVVNANMVAHAPGGLAAFLLEKTAGLNYLIDPLTHAFQHDPSAIQNDESELKTSFKEIAEKYGSPFIECAGERPILPRDLENQGVLKTLVEKCLTFQRRSLASVMADSKAMKYLDLSPEKLEPYALVAPYFFMTETTVDRWLRVLERAGRAAIALAREWEKKIFLAIVVSQGVVTSQRSRDTIIGAMRGLPVDGFLLWVDNLDEQVAGWDELKGLLEIARGLRADGQREVINLHGGYFSVLAAGVLGGNAMSGVTHGPEFGEYRSVVPVGGGIPIARYYLPHLHARVRYRDTLRLLNAKGWLDDAATYHDRVCNCEECKSTITGDIRNFTAFGQGKMKAVRRGTGIVRIEYPTAETKKHCLRHYLQRKDMEYRFAATASPDDIAADLKRGVDEFEQVAGLDAVAHLDLWYQVLTAEPLRTA